MHRSFAFPPLVGSFVLLFLRIDESVPGEGSVDGGAGRSTIAELPSQFVRDAACSPPAVLSAHLADGRFDRRCDAIWVRMGPPRLVHQAVEARLFVPCAPRCDGLPAHPSRSSTSTIGAPSRTSMTARKRTSTAIRAVMAESGSGE